MEAFSELRSFTKEEENQDDSKKLVAVLLYINFNSYQFISYVLDGILDTTNLLD